MEWKPIVTEYFCHFDEDSTCEIARHPDGDDNWHSKSIVIGYVDVSLVYTYFNKASFSLEETKNICEAAWKWARANHPPEYFKDKNNSLIFYTIEHSLYERGDK